MFKISRFWLIGMLVVAPPTGLFAAPLAPPAFVDTRIAPEKLRGQIAYAQGSDLWVVDPRSGKRARLFRQLFSNQLNGVGIRNVAWTPDRRTLVWTFWRAGAARDTNDTGNELFAMRFDGTGKRRLTHTNFELFSSSPQISPNGKQVLYSRTTGYRMGGPGYTGTEIRVVNLDGSNDRRITGDIQNMKSAVTSPFWIRDGKRIVFKRYEGNLDYVSGYDIPAAWKTIALNGRDERSFSGNWAPFRVPWSSLKTPSRFAPPEELMFDLKPAVSTRNKPFRPSIARLQSVEWALSPTSSAVAFSATQPKKSSPGVRERGLWVADFRGRTRLLATGDQENGPQLIGWL